MSGLIAIKGFDYQATVTLDRVFEHFDTYGATARVHPEKIDDLDLTWEEPEGSQHSRFIQIKKQREDENGNRKPRAWSVQEVIDETLPNTIRHLTGNLSEQVWIFGDEIEADLKALIAAGINAPTSTPAAYFKMVHVLARNHALAKLDQATRASIIRWNISDALLTDPLLAFASVTNAYAQIIKTKASVDVVHLYRNKAQSVHDVLPDVLSRTKIDCLYGSEEEVAQRVCDKLVARFELEPSLVEHTIFRNLRGFVNDISKQSGRSFDQVEFDLEMRSIWPQMLVVKEPPPLPDDHLPRTGITDLLTKNWTGKAVEVLGVSGSGKTTLASETIARSQASDPHRLALYIEVTETSRLRDALAGVGFHLRHSGYPGLFAIAVDQRGSNEEVLKKLGRAFAALPQSLLLIFDLVEGTCNDAFARDLATFVRNLSSADCHLVVVGQEDAMRGLNALDRQSNGVAHFDLHGFDFEEFFKLAAPKHADASREQLSEIYEKVTAGKAARLLPLLAKLLVAAPSYTAMARIAAQPAEDRLEFAEREKFARISAGARSAAERIMCFALAFSRADAENCFPSENIGMAIRELTELGLLRTNADQTFEMHETVRAGLEGLLSLETRRSAHSALAAQCRRNGLLAAEIFHLEKSGDLALAKTRGREAVLGGQEWSGLAAWITRHQVITDAELLAVAASDEPVDGLYLLPGLLLRSGQTIDVAQIIKLLRDQPNRVIKQYPWGAALFAAALAVAPKALTDLVAFALQNYSERRDLEQALGMLLIAARRAGASTDLGILAFFNSADIEIKRALLPLMLFENRKENLSAAFGFISVADVSANERLRPASRSLALQIETAADAVEILDALQEIEPHIMLGSKSTLLGALAPLFWQKRRLFQKFCGEILGSATADTKVLKNAIRILIFVMDPGIVAICEELAANGPETIRAHALLMLSLVPTLVDQQAYQSRVLDIALPISVRQSSFAILAAIGADMSSLYNNVKTVETSAGMRGWDVFFLLLSAQTPFPDAIELLRSQLSAANGMPPKLLLGALQTLGAMPIAAAASLLQDLLSHSDRDIRLTAAQVLAGRRSRSARLSLVAQFSRETDPAVVVQLAVSTVASGPDAAVSFAHPLISEQALQLWQCILSDRLGDTNDAQRLIAVATNATLHWQLRRAAISAAGKLPFATAMASILPLVMAERSSLAIDQHHALTCHSALSWLLSNEAAAITATLNHGKRWFAAFWADWIDQLMDADLWPDGMPTAAAAAEWLYDRLRHHGSPANDSAPEIILNELHIPLLQSAALRSLRRTGRGDLIDAELAQASSLWLALKCLLQRRMGDRDAGLADHLRGLIATSRYKDKLILQRILENEFAGPIPITQTSEPLAAADPKPSLTLSKLTYEDARRMLEGEAECALPDLSTPRILDSISQEQFERLVLLADPMNDRYKTTETYVPQMSFSRNGYSVARRQSTYTAASEPAGSILRPVIAAANSFGVDISWHEEALNDALAGRYISRLVASLNAQDSSARFYEEVLAYPDLLLPELTKEAVPINCRHIDGRIAPTLAAYASSGTDEFFETLCTITSLVQSSEIDPALAALFRRWVQSFDLRAAAPQNFGNYRLWRGFNKLHKHARFELITGWQKSVSDVLRCSLSWSDKQDLARVLERHPSSYTQIETILFREEDWRHFARDEISRLEEAANRLFGETTD